MAFTVYAIRHPHTREVGHVGIADDQDPESVVRRRHKFKPDLRGWVDGLPDEPVIEVLDVVEQLNLARSRKYLWRSKLMRPLAFVSEEPTRPPVPVEPDCEPVEVTVPVPPDAITAAIRLRTELRTWDEIAGRLTALGSPPGHSWTPGEVRHVVAQSFYARI